MCEFVSPNRYPAAMILIVQALAIAKLQESVDGAYQCGLLEREILLGRTKPVV